MSESRGNPLAGVDPDELVDTRPYCKEFTDKLTNNGSVPPIYTHHGPPHTPPRLIDKFNSEHRCVLFQRWDMIS